MQNIKIRQLITGWLLIVVKLTLQLENFRYELEESSEFLQPVEKTPNIMEDLDYQALEVREEEEDLKHFFCLDQIVKSEMIVDMVEEERAKENSSWIFV